MKFVRLWVLSGIICFGQQIAPNSVFRVKTTTALSSRLNQKGDRISAYVVAPPAFQGATVEGQIREAKSSGAINKTSQLNLATPHQRSKSVR